MAVTHYTLTCDFGTLLSGAYDPTLAPVVVSIETNVASNEGIVDTVANTILLGPIRATANVNGVVTFANLIGSDSSPADINLAAGTLQYRVSADYVNSMTRRRGERWSSGWFSLTANKDLADIMPEQYISATYLSQVTDELQTYVDQAEYWAKQAQDIAGLDDSDDAIALLIRDPTSDTTDALHDTLDVRYVALAGNQTILGGLTINGVLNAVTQLQENGVRVYSASNKPTLTALGAAANVQGGAERSAALSATSGTSTADLSVASVFTVSPTGALTLAFTNIPASGTACTASIIITQGATAYAISLPAGGKWIGGAPVQAINKVCVVTMMTVNGGTTWLAMGSVES